MGVRHQNKTVLSLIEVEPTPSRWSCEIMRILSWICTKDRDDLTLSTGKLQKERIKNNGF